MKRVLPEPVTEGTQDPKRSLYELIGIFEDVGNGDRQILEQLLTLANRLLQARKSAMTGAISLHLDEGFLKKVRTETWEKIS